MGRNLARLFDEKRATLAADYGWRPSLIGVAELNGSATHTGGLCIPEVLNHFGEHGSLSAYPGSGKPGWQGMDVLINTEADVLIETTPTNIETGEPALSHVRRALQRGMHVVSANKGPFIHSYQELRRLADQNNVQLKLSAAAAAALPTLDVAQTCLAGTDILSIEGVLNGTSNYILSRMRTQQEDFATALQAAQQAGIAEADPRLDVEGFDTANKLALIANITMRLNMTPGDVKRTGISQVTAEEIQQATTENRVIRLVGRVQRDTGNKPRATVRPEALAPDHPLANVDGSEKGISYTTDTMDRITVTGGKSDPVGAAAALLKDLINIYSH
ncbi:MAG: homoserine dehydrogenase [Planctomycetaceae bacterium]